MGVTMTAANLVNKVSFQVDMVSYEKAKNAVKSLRAEMQSLQKTALPMGMSGRGSAGFIGLGNIGFGNQIQLKSQLRQMREKIKEETRKTKAAAALELRKNEATSRGLDSFTNALGKYAPKLNTNQLDYFRNRFEHLNKSMMEGSMSVAQYRSRLGYLNSQMGTLSRNSKSFSQGYDDIKRSILGATAAYSGWAAIQSITRAGAQMENTKTLMKSVFGPETQSQIEFLKKTTNELGTEFESSATNFAKFSFSAKMAGASTAELNDAFKSFSMAGNMMGASTDQMNSAFLALEQMFS